MFLPDRWAVAFTELCGESLEEGVEAFRVFISCTARLKGRLEGTNKARRFEVLLRGALKEAGFDSGALSAKADLSRNSRLENRGKELALRFAVFLMKKNYFKYRQVLLAEIEKAADRMRGVVRVVLESAAPADSAMEEKIKAELARRTCAREIILERRVMPELIAGYRVYIGAELLDTSFQGLMHKMALGLGVPSSGEIAADPIDSMWEIV
ncbi:MAG: F0F1 ATP synthase subunit delta [Spirochaetaceae bacterium]|jgi:F0F1-type ATP synthase delta subunit|nr:F0F1 ATP synthase subunit delta [Spirochaetaceae bacterium]